MYIDVEPIGFNRGFYTVDVRYYYRVTADAFVGAVRPVEISGLCVFDKRVILFGSESSAKVFSSCFDEGPDTQMRRCSVPTAVVEAVDPIVLNMKLVDVCECHPCDCELTEIPPCICACFCSDLCFGNQGKRVYVSLGQFSIIRLERDTQLLMPVYDYCLPEKECTCGGSEDDPCEIFRHVKFPVDEFFPPNQAPGIPACYREVKNGCMRLSTKPAPPVERTGGARLLLVWLGLDFHAFRQAVISQCPKRTTGSAPSRQKWRTGSVRPGSPHRSPAAQC